MQHYCTYCNGHAIALTFRYAAGLPQYFIIHADLLSVEARLYCMDYPSDDGNIPMHDEQYRHDTEQILQGTS